MIARLFAAWKRMNTPPVPPCACRHCGKAIPRDGPEVMCWQCKEFYAAYVPPGSGPYRNAQPEHPTFQFRR